MDTQTLTLIAVILSWISLATVLFNVISAQRSQAELERIVAPWGWHILLNTQHLVARWPGHPLRTGFARGVARAVTGAFTGRPVVIFEFRGLRRRRDTVTGRRSSTTTVTALSAPGRYAGLDVSFLPREERLVRTKLAADDVPTGDERIDSRWRVRSADPQVALKVLQPHVREFLAAQPVARPVRIVDGDLLSWHVGPLDPAVVHETLSWLAHVDAVVAGPAPGDGGTTDTIHTRAPVVSQDPRSDRWKA